MKQFYFKSIFLSLLMMVAGMGNAFAADKWVKTDPADLVTGNVVMIVDLNSDRAMSNDNGTSAAPAAIRVYYADDDKTESTGITGKTVPGYLQWVVTVSKDNDNVSFTFGVSGTSKYLYCTNTNNGVRVGTNSNNAFTMVDNGSGKKYLKNTATSRYVGVYNSQDWRCYDNTTGNIAGTVIAFYKKVESSATLTKIDISGTYPTTFNVGDEFSHEGMKVTATYSDNTTKDVSSAATFTGYDMSTAGEQTVTVSYENGEEPKTATYTITVNVLTGDDYTLVENVTDLRANDKVIIVNTDAEKAMGQQRDNNRAATAIRIDDGGNKAFVPSNSDVQVFTLEGNSNGWYFNTGSGYIYATSGSSNHLKTNTLKVAGDNAKAVITIEDEETSVVFQGENKRNVLQYNPNNGNPIFSCYASASQSPVNIYKLDDGKPKPTVSFADPVVEITYGDNYDKQKATAEGFSGDLVYSSSDDKVVKFHGNSVIDVLKPGTVTITATAPATETTKESSATYTLKIYEPADESEALDEDFSKCNGTNSQFGGSSGFIAVPDGLGWETSNCHAGAGYLKIGTSSVGVATSPAFSVNGEVPLSFAIAPWIANNDTEGTTVIVSLENAEFGNGESTLELDIKDLAQGKFTIFDQYTIVGNSAAVRISFSATNAITGHRYFLDNVVVGGGAHEINLKFSSAGYLTWVATADIDFANTDGVTAYKITEATPKKITMVEVDKVKAGEAVMLKGSGTVKLTRTTDAEAFTDNKMLPCKDGSVTGNGVNGVTNTDVYVLGNGKNGLGFYMLKGTLQAGKGYLSVTEEAGNAKQNFIGFEVVTGLDAVEAKDADDAAIYNLQGIRVARPQKGIYVKNGKKFVVK